MTATDKRTFMVGDRAEIEVVISEEFIDEFARFSGDLNPLHLDADFAESTRFKRRIAHGMSYGAIFSRLIGMELPGPGALWTSQSFRFAQPVFLGDRLRLSVEVTAVSKSTNTLTLACKAENQSGEVVMSGSSEVMILESAPAEKRAPRRDRRVALVTGGSRGIGAAVARRLAADGFAVAITYKSSTSEAAALARSLENCIALQSDAAAPDRAAAVVAEVRRRYGAPDTLVLNAGGRDIFGSAADCDFDRFAQQLDIHLAGPHALVAACIDDMVKARHGAIIAIGSTFAAGAPPTGMAPYVVGKSALAAYMRCLAVELGPKGIRANVVEPGMTETALIAAMSDRTRKVAVAQNPLRRLAVPDDVAGAVAFLASDEGAYINGHTLIVSGGSFMP